MALTYRTGSGGKGSALTIEELDNNFRYFTGSHSVTGSFGVSGSIILTGSLDIEGSITGPLDITGSVNINKDGGDILTIDDTDLDISTKFESDGIGSDNSFWQSPDGTNYNHVIGTQFSYPGNNLYIGYQGVTKTIINAQTGNVGIGTETPNAKLDVNGAITSSGNISTSANISGANLNVSGSLNFIGGVDSTLRAGDGIQEIELNVVDANNGNSPDNLKIALDNQGEGYFMAKILILGDEEDIYGGTTLTIDAGTNKFLLEEGDVGIGTSTPTSKLQVVGLAEHADNAAALTAGLTIGAFYRTGDLLKVVH